MCDRRACGIVAREPAGGGNAGQFRQPHADRGEMLPVQILCDLNRLKPGSPFEIVFDPRQIFGGQSEEVAQRSKDAVAALLLHPVGNDIDAEIGAVVGDRHTGAVDDPAAPWRDQRQIDAVALGKKPVFVVLIDR
jgi:hypothetical protein